MRDYIEYLEQKTLKPFIMDGTGRIGIDYADMAGKPASYFTGSWLTAMQPVTVYSDASTNNPVKKLQTGDIVGRISSYVERNGKIWWMLEGTSVNGSGGFVEHAPGRFDSAIALESSGGKQHEQQIEDLKKDPIGDTVQTLATGVKDVASGAGKALSFLGDNLIWLIFGILVIVVVSAYKYKTA